MSTADNSLAIENKIRTTKPQLLSIYQNFKESLAHLVTLNNSYRVCLLKISLNKAV